MFMYLYNVSFLSLDGVTTTRIAIVAFVGLLIIKRNCMKEVFRFYRKELIVLLLFLPFIIWNLIHYWIGHGVDSTQFARSFYFFLYVIILSPIVAIVIGDRTRFLYAVFFSGIAQACLVYIHFVMPEYRGWLYTIVRETGNVSLLSEVRSAGFSNGASSALSLVVSLSVFCGMVLYTETKDVLAKIFLLLGTLLIMSSTILIGRLGLIMSFYFFATIFLIKLSALKNIIGIALVSLVVMLFLGQLAFEYLAQNDKFETSVIGWAFSILNNDDVTVERLSHMTIPPLNINNIFIGNGVVKLSNGFNASGSDIGYIQTYFAVGLVMTIYFYIFLLSYLIKHLRKVSSKLIPLVLLAPLMIVELKEPFVFKYMYPFFILVFFYLSTRKYGN